MPFAPEYVRYVLNENFEDAKKLFFSPLVAIHYAHVVMLASQGIISREDARGLRKALDAVSAADLHGVTFDGICEDLFFYVARLIVSECGEDVAGRLHTARSRNDIDMTMYRMRLREFVLGLIGAAIELREALTGVAVQHRHTIFAAHTHTQPAQPTTLAHYLLAIIEQLERDTGRLKAAYETTNRCPLGACAITGTGFPIDRDLTSSLLGFSGPTGNTYGSIATVDYLLESTSAAAVMLTGLGRFTQDLLLWCTAEFNFVRLADGFVQTSSIMPQKRNPVAIEHARAIGSKALGQASAVMLAVHNTPFGDVVDTEDDLQPLVFSMFRDATRAVRLVAAALPTAQFDRQRPEARAREGWTTLTELADSLVRDHGLPFRSAHAVASALAARRAQDPQVTLPDALAVISAEITGVEVRYSEEQLATILSPRHFVEVRRTFGGPAPDETARALDQSRQLQAADQRWWNETTEALKTAEKRLAERSAEL